MTKPLFSWLSRLKPSLSIFLLIVSLLSGITGFQAMQTSRSAMAQEAREPSETNCGTYPATATFNPFTPLTLNSPNPDVTEGACRDMPMLSIFPLEAGNPRSTTLSANQDVDVHFYYNNGANPASGQVITNPIAGAEILRSGNTYTVKGRLSGQGANPLTSATANGGGDLTLTVPNGYRLEYVANTTYWYPEARMREYLAQTIGNTPSITVNDSAPVNDPANPTGKVASSPIITSFPDFQITNPGLNIGYEDNNKDAVQDPGSNTLSPGFLNQGYVFFTLKAVPEPKPALQIQLVSDPVSGTAVKAGDTIDYTVRYRNSGNADATNTVIKVVLDPDLDATTPEKIQAIVASCQPIACTYDAATRTLTWNVGTLAPSEDLKQVSFSATVKNDVFTGEIREQATIAATNVNNNTAIPSNEVFHPLQDLRTPVLAITKAANPASGTTVAPGSTITYTINYNNTGTGAATNAVITDVLDSKLTFVSCSNSCTSSGQTLTWNVGNINAGGTGSVTVTATVSAGATGTVLNKASITSPNFNGGTPVVSNETSHPIQALTPSVEITKAVNRTTVAPGETIGYTLTIRNSGQVNLTNTIITDTLDSKTTFVANSCTPAVCTVSGQNLTANLGNLNIGESKTLTFQVRANAGATGQILNKANLDTAQTDPKDSNQTTVNIVSPNLSLSKAANKSQVRAGDTVTFTLNYQNLGQATANNATLTDVLDSKLTFVSCSSNCTTSGQTITWNLGNLASGASGSVSVTATVKAGSTGEIRNKATLDSDNTDPVDSPEIVIPIIADPNLEITKATTKTEVRPGEQITYTINYRNSGDGQATGVVIRDTLETDLTFVSCTNNCTQVNGQVTWNIGTLAPNASGSVSLTAQVKENTSADVVRNTAIIDSDQTPEKPSDPVVTPILRPNLVVIKTANRNQLGIGEQVRFDIEYANTGQATADNVTIKDSLDSKLEFVSCTNNCTRNQELVTWNIGNLAPGASGTVSVVAKVKDNSTGTVRNTAIIDSPSTPEEETPEVIIPIVQPNLEIVKSAQPSSGTSVTENQEITYNLQVRNLGPGAATNVQVRDNVPANTTLVANSCTPVCEQEGNTLVWKIVRLETSETFSNFSFKVKVNEGMESGSIRNQALVRADNVGDKPSNETIHPIVKKEPLLIINKAANRNAVKAGETIAYTLDLANIGTTQATGVTVKDTLDEKTTYVANSCAPASTCTYDAASRTLTWTLGNLDIAERRTLSFQVTVNAGALGEVRNTGTVDSNETEPENSNEVLIPIVIDLTQPNLIIFKTANRSPVRPGDRIAYTLNYANIGGAVAKNVTITDVLDEKTTYVANSCRPLGTCTYDSASRTLTWRLGDLGAGVSGAASFQVTVNQEATGNVRNTASIDSDSTDPRDSNEVVIPITLDPNLILDLVKRVSGSSARPGDLLTYNIDYANNTSESADGVTITDVLPSSLEYVAGTCQPAAQCTYDTTTRTLRWNLGTLASGARGTVWFQARVTAEAVGQIDNTAVITCPNCSPKSSTVTIVCLNDCPNCNPSSASVSSQINSSLTSSAISSLSSSSGSTSSSQATSSAISASSSSAQTSSAISSLVNSSQVSSSLVSSQVSSQISSSAGDGSIGISASAVNPSSSSSQVSSLNSSTVSSVSSPVSSISNSSSQVSASIPFGSSSSQIVSSVPVSSASSMTSSSQVMSSSSQTSSSAATSSSSATFSAISSSQVSSIVASQSSSQTSQIVSSVSFPASSSSSQTSSSSISSQPNSSAANSSSSFSSSASNPVSSASFSAVISSSRSNSSQVSASVPFSSGNSSMISSSANSGQTSSSIASSQSSSQTSQIASSVSSVGPVSSQPASSAANSSSLISSSQFSFSFSNSAGNSSQGSSVNSSQVNSQISSVSSSNNNSQNSSQINSSALSSSPDGNSSANSSQQSSQGISLCSINCGNSSQANSNQNSSKNNSANSSLNSSKNNSSNGQTITPLPSSSSSSSQGRKLITTGQMNTLLLTSVGMLPIAAIIWHYRRRQKLGKDFSQGRVYYK